MSSESQKQGTQTSAFGTSGRINHDASAFYGSKLYADQELPEPDSWIENPIPAESLDRLHCASSIDMSAIPDNSVHLMVTSPPYNAKKEYDEDLSLAEYRELLYTVLAETYKKLVTGGRACIIVDSIISYTFL
ncbi:MAG: DNA methyltransferase [Candidatus Poribacteria bacterium]|nr:DNA methyltransferase [Candidatus Poribacteria bacterium]